MVRNVADFPSKSGSTFRFKGSFADFLSLFLSASESPFYLLKNRTCLGVLPMSQEICVYLKVLNIVDMHV